MEPSDKSSFEEAWSDAFTNANIPPPPATWDAIERALDEDKRKKSGFVIFWLNNVRTFRAAAGIALFGVLGWLGYEFVSKPAGLSDKNVAQQGVAQQSVAQQQEAAKKDTQPSLSTNENAVAQTKADLKAENNSGNSSKIEDKNQSLISKNLNKNIDNQSLNLKNNIDFSKNNKSLSSPKQNQPSSIESDFVQETLANKATSQTTKTEEVSGITERFLSQNSVESIVDNRVKLDASVLAKKNNFKLPPNRLNRKLLVEYEFTEVAEKKSARRNDSWFGLNTGVGSFNAGFAEKGLNTLALESFKSASRTDNPNVQSMGTPSELKPEPIKNPFNRSSAREAYRTGVSFGKSFGKIFLVESGVQYFRGRSMVESNTYSYNPQSGTRNSFLAQQLNNNKDGSFAADNSITQYASNSEFLNRYEYVSVPVQLGLTILSKYKLNFSVMGGASADVFVGNTIGGNSFQNVASNKISIQDGVYKPLNISVLGSGRLNYRLPNRWVMYLGGQFQQGLGSALKQDDLLQLNLRQMGVQYGVNYKF